MRKKSKKLKKAGSPPGTLIFTGEKKLDQPLLTLVQFNPSEIKERIVTEHDLPHNPPDKITWLDVRGIHDADLIDRLGKKFHVHPLILEDILNPNQRPKLEEYDNGLFLVLQNLKCADGDFFRLETEQIGIFFNEKVIISFQENPDDTFKPVRERLETGRGRIRQYGTDYLVYAMMDSVVDGYFEIFERLETRIAALEDAILARTTATTKSEIHHIKTETIILRKAISPLREAISRMSRSDNPLVAESSKFFLRDLADHTFQLMDLLESHRDVINGLYDLYLSEISYRMNSVMQVLTVISTIFIPLTFLVGVYGMNFDNLPELHWRNGYFYLWGLMLAMALGMLVYFRKRRWL